MENSQVIFNNFFFRIFRPNTTSDVQPIFEHAVKKYGSTEEPFVNMGIEQVPGSATEQGWYWGSGAVFDGPWCQGQPNDYEGVNQTQLSIRIKDASSFCYQDDAVDLKTYFVCQQGNHLKVLNALLSCYVWP